MKHQETNKKIFQKVKAVSKQRDDQLKQLQKDVQQSAPPTNKKLEENQPAI